MILKHDAGLLEYACLLSSRVDSSWKYPMMVKYVLETEKLSIEDVFNRDFDIKDLEARVFRSL
jgi:hypothetical protein